MPRTARQHAQRRAEIRRRRLVAGAALASVLLLAFFLVRGFGAAGETGILVLTDGDRTLQRVSLVGLTRDGELDESRLRRTLESVLPTSTTVTRGRARITYRYDRAATITRALRRGREGGRVGVARQAVSASVQTPILRQAQANTCESAALSILLGALGRPTDQTELQRALPTSGPLDPQSEGDARVWGDPDRGYVGRPDGGGVAGGFGVLQGPIQATARRYGVALRDITGASAAAVYTHLLAGRPVMAWVGLSDGPYGSWTSPEGRRVRVNFGEHTVVLYGVRSDGQLLVSNPLEGTDEVWPRSKFELMWKRLDRRALAA